MHFCDSPKGPHIPMLPYFFIHCLKWRAHLHHLTEPTNYESMPHRKHACYFPTQALPALSQSNEMGSASLISEIQLPCQGPSSRTFHLKFFGSPVVKLSAHIRATEGNLQALHTLGLELLPSTHSYTLEAEFRPHASIPRVLRLPPPLL